MSPEGSAAQDDLQALYRTGQLLARELRVRYPVTEGWMVLTAWGSRIHLPLQLFWGKVSMAQRGRRE